MWTLKCALALLLLAFPASAQKLTGRRGIPAAKSFVITAEVHHEGSFELQRMALVRTNWIAFTNFNAFPGTNTFADTRTNHQSYYRLVRLNVPPAITNQPTGLTNLTGQEVRLEAGGTGSWPIRYQWLRNGTPIEGATSNKLAFPGQVPLSGNYTLRISNSWGAALSSAAIVKTINPVATNIAGKKIRYVIKGAQGNFINSGSFETTYNPQGFYNTTGSSVFLNDAGTWQYGTFPGQPIGRVFLAAGSFIYPDGAAIDLTFTNQTSGAFNLQAVNFTGRQFGDFTFIE